MECSGCFWWKKDYGMWCFNGWSGMDRNDGHCHFEPKRIPTRGNDYCSHWKDKSLPVVLPTEGEDLP